MKDLTHYRELLEAELKNLVKQLESLGRRNPDQKDDWETVKKDGVENADELDVSESIGEYEDNNAVLENLETRLHEVNKALKLIDEGAYGVCEICGNNIEEDRLEANPAASTCKTHM